MAVDWDGMTAEDVLATVESAPGVMSGWIDEHYGDWVRKELRPNEHCFASIQSMVGGYWTAGLYVTGCNLRLGNDYPSAKAAKAAVDAKLIEEGWKLCK